MTDQIKLSSAFNTALGVIPAVVSIIICAFSTIGMALLAGALAGIAYTILLYVKRKSWIPNYILYPTTVVLLILSIIHLFSPFGFSTNKLPVFLEVAVLIPLLIIYYNGNYLMRVFCKRNKKVAVQGIQSAIVSIRILLLFSLVHLLMLVVGYIATRSASNGFMWFQITVMPLLVFLLSIVFNYVGIQFFNKTMSQTRFIPVVNEKGGITGRIIESDLATRKNTVKVPVVRIAIESHGMLFLCDNQPGNILGTGKVDTPLESVIYFKETLEDAVKRLLIITFPTARRLKPQFNIKYQFKDDETDRIVYLFVLNVKDDIILCDSRFENGKLWTFQQIEHNLNKGFFSKCFEQEYEHLESVIGIIRKYRES